MFLTQFKKGVGSQMSVSYFCRITRNYLIVGKKGVPLTKRFIKSLSFSLKINLHQVTVICSKHATGKERLQAALASVVPTRVRKDTEETVHGGGRFAANDKYDDILNQA